MPRLFRIQNIKGGAGNDIIDMTSQKFEYSGGSLNISGGDGDDIIWANTGKNMLFGDAGNDRIIGASSNDVFAGGIGNDTMHGGGGDDIFAFCDNWGTDTVEQLESGTVTLWFYSGSIDNWDAESLTYTDGENSVTVSGISAEKITLKFDSDETAACYQIYESGGFFEFTFQKVFEDAGSGILASV